MRIVTIMTLNGNKVREFLGEKGKSREWLAAQLGCSLSTVDKFLGGRMPRAELLFKLAQEMGCQVEDLVPMEAKNAS